MSTTGYVPPIQPRSRSRSRSRRHSSVSFSSRPTFTDGIQRISGVRVKFKHKGAIASGITLGEAQGDIRLSSRSGGYTFRDMHADHKGRINIRIKVSDDLDFHRSTG
jgi:hypothetical protein